MNDSKQQSPSNTSAVGFIGQGWIGGAYANNFEERGFEVVRYGLEEEFKSNKDKIKECDYVFIAVPTPTKDGEFDDSIVKDVVGLVKKGGVAIIKSTTVPGTTESIQDDNPDIFVMHSPEFLSKTSAQHDADNPPQNIIGIARDEEAHRQKAKEVLDMLPSADQGMVCTSREAELFKYIHNIFGYIKVVTFNLMRDAADSIGADWEKLEKAIEADPMIANEHIYPVHKTGRGAGGHCFIKDFPAFEKWFNSSVKDDDYKRILEAIETKNLDLLKQSEKDQDICQEVYGEKI